MQLPYDKVIGIWTLLYQNNTAGCTISACTPAPFEDLGTITITPTRYFSAVITRTDYAILPEGETWQSTNDSVRGRIALKSVCYAGPISLARNGSDILSTVDVETALNPGWIGTKQVRIVTFREEGDDTLMVLNPVYGNGTKSTQFLFWKKKMEAS